MSLKFDCYLPNRKLTWQVGCYFHESQKSRRKSSILFIIPICVPRVDMIIVFCEKNLLRCGFCWGSCIPNRFSIVCFPIKKIKRWFQSIYPTLRKKYSKVLLLLFIVVAVGLVWYRWQKKQHSAMFGLLKATNIAECDTYQ